MQCQYSNSLKQSGPISQVSLPTFGGAQTLTLGKYTGLRGRNWAYRRREEGWALEIWKHLTNTPSKIGVESIIVSSMFIGSAPQKQIFSKLKIFGSQIGRETTVRMEKFVVWEKSPN